MIKELLMIALLLVSYTEAVATDLANNYTLADITGEKNITLTGQNPSYTFYLPVPNEEQGVLKNLTVNLQIHHSPSLANDSTLTASINNLPISSLLLTQNNTSTLWKIKIPLNEIKDNNYVLTLNGYFRIAQSNTINDNNPASWAILNSASKVTYQIASSDYQPNIAHLPFPFINAQEPAKSHTIVGVTSVSPAITDLLISLSSYLNKKSTWRGISIKATPLSNLNKLPQINETNVILLGTIQEINSTLQNLSLRSNANGQFIDGKGNLIPADVGIIVLLPSPWNRSKALLILTGANDKAIRKSVMALHHHKNLTGATSTNNVLLVKNLTVHKERTLESFTLKDLGYSDRYFYGPGLHKVNYKVGLNSQYSISSTNVVLSIAYDPFLVAKSNILSTLNLLVNGELLDSISLVPPANHYNWKVSIPGDYLMNGKNYLTLSSQLSSSDNSIPSSAYAQSWIAIRNNSTIHVDYSSKPLLAQTIKEIPALFNQATQLILPENIDEVLLNTILKIGTLATKPLLLKTTFSNTNSFDTDKNLIIVGKVTTNKYLNKLLEKAPIQIVGTKLYRSRYYGKTQILPEKTSWSLAEIVTSPWNSDKSILIITGTDNNLIAKAIDAITSDNLIKYNGKAVLFLPTGKYYLFDKPEPTTAKFDYSTAPIYRFGAWLSSLFKMNKPS